MVRSKLFDNRRNFLFIKFIAILLLALIGSGVIVTGQAIAVDLELVGSFDTWAKAVDIAVSGDFAYVTRDNWGLEVINISDPTAPEHKGQEDTLGYSYGVAVSGDYAYVADGTEGLQIIKISNPESPDLVWSVDTDGYAYGVAVSGDYAYVADGTEGLQIIKISDHKDPDPKKGSFDTAGIAWDVAVSGKYAYIADEYSGIQVIDISNSDAPNFEYNLDTDGAAYGIEIAGDFAYVADGYKGLQIIDISNRRIIGNANTDGQARRVTVSGNYAYVADGTDGLKVIDVSDPMAPFEAGDLDTNGSSYGVAFSRSHAYVADGYGKLKVVKIFLPAEISDPVPGSEFSSTSIRFTWNDSGADQYRLQIGTTGSGSEDVYYSNQGTNTSEMISGLPDSGETLYVRLSSLVNGEWLFNDYTYTACTASSNCHPVSVIPDNPEGVNRDHFGNTLAISDDWAVVGAYKGRAAYIYKREGSNWVQKTILTGYQDEFGKDVAISEDYIIVGSNAHGAFVYKRNGDEWSVMGKPYWTRLNPVGGVGYSYHGSSVSISGNYAIVGAFGDQEKGSQAGAAHIYKLEGDRWVHKQKLVAEDGATNDRFGYSVSISGDHAIIGAYQNGGIGSAYIFIKDNDETWDQLSKLVPNDGDAGDQFGIDVVISDDCAIIGSPNNNDYLGAAYVFKLKNNSWEEGEKLTDVNGQRSDYWGRYVNIDGNQAIISSQRTEAMLCERTDGDWSVEHNISIASPYGYRTPVAVSGNYAVFGNSNDIDDTDIAGGAAYFYNLTTDTHTRVIPDYHGGWDRFGQSVSISGNYAIVGAHNTNHNNRSDGTAYIFKKEGCNWIQKKLLAKSDGKTNDYFGLSVSISGDYAAVGAWGDDNPGFYSSGAVYVYQRNGEDWTESARLTAGSDMMKDGRFGYSVSLSGNYLLVGATQSNAVYFFKKEDFGNNWEFSQKIESWESSNTHFGYSVSIWENYAIIGCRYDTNQNGTWAGAAYIFEYETDQWIQKEKLIADGYDKSGYFGTSVSIHSDYAVAGAPKAGGWGDVYIYKRENGAWNQKQKITGDANRWHIGDSLAINENYLLINVKPEANEPKGLAPFGALYELDGENWIKKDDEYLTYDNQSAPGGVALSDDYVVVGASTAANSYGVNSGEVYFYNY